MNISLYIARRYLFAKKSTNAINIISAISATGIFVGSAVLLIILSVFNGFEDMALKMFNTFTPQLIITPKVGKTFYPNTVYFNQLKADKRIASYTEVLSENAILSYNDKQAVGLVKGVSNDYLKNDRLDSIIVQGAFVLTNTAGTHAVIGAGLQDYLRVNTTDPFTELRFFSPNKNANFNDISEANHFITLSAPVSGVYEVQQDFNNTAIVPLAFARKLLNEAVKISAIELNVTPNTNTDALKAEIENNIGTSFMVRNRVQQNAALYHVLSSEKRMVYLILTFILIIAIVNIIGSLTMLVIEKIKDITILNSLGANRQTIQRIFLFEGMMITLFGCISGLFFGLVFAMLQKHFGFIKIGGGTTAYPITLHGTDVIIVFLTVATFSFFASLLAAKLSVKKISFTA